MRKHLLLFLFASLFTAGLFAQTSPAADPPPQPANFSVWSQRLDMSAYAGKKYRLQAAIRAEIGADSAGALVFIRNEFPQGGRNAWTYMDNMINRIVRHRDWKTYTLESTVDAKAPFVGFGCNAFGRGNFFYDDLRISVETSPGKWQNIAVPNGNFEQKTVAPWLQTQMGARFTAQDATVSLEKSGAFEGKQCLRIENNFIPYGSNPAAGRYFEVNGIRLYGETYGQGQPLVVLHTSGGSIAEAATHIPELAKTYRVIAFDNRGQGKSVYNGPTLSYAQLTDDVAKALGQMGIDSAYVWGFSDGAIQGLLLALDHPRLVKKLLASVPNILSDTTAVHPIIYQTIEKETAAATDPLDRRLGQLMLSGSGRSFENLAQIQCPVLLVTGDRDWVRLEHTLRIFQTIPRVQLCVLPGTTHRSPWEKRALFLQLATSFFGEPFAMPDTRDWFRQ